jgi:hypothetical protein
MLRDVLQIGNRNKIPFTFSVVATAIAVWIVNILLKFALVPLLAFSAGGAWWLKPWTLVTWPLVAPTDPIGMLFSSLMAWWVLGSLERSWGTRNVMGFFFGCAALLALGVALGGVLLKENLLVMGLYSALCAPVVSFCTLNPHVRMNFFIVTLPALVFAWLSVALLWWHIGIPYIGLFALVAPAFAYWYARGGQFVIGNFFDTFDKGAKRPALTLQDYTKAPAQKKKRQKQDKAFEEIMRRSYNEDDKSPDNINK